MTIVTVILVVVGSARATNTSGAATMARESSLLLQLLSALFFIISLCKIKNIYTNYTKRFQKIIGSNYRIDSRVVRFYLFIEIVFNFPEFSVVLFLLIN